MKIYEIGTGYAPIPAQISAATEIVVEELTRAFAKQNIPVEILDISTQNRAPHSLPIREVRVPPAFSGTDVHLGILHKLKRVVYSVALAGTLKKILKATKEKVVFHFHNQYNLFFFLKLTPRNLRKNCLIAYTNHSGIWRLDWEQIGDTIRRRYFQEAECMRQADAVFVLNEETKRNAAAHVGVPEEKLIVIGNGVNTDVYHPMTAEEAEAEKQKHGLTGKTVIAQVGSVYENKGQLRSLEGLLPLLKLQENLVFAYAGGIVDEAYQQAIQDFAVRNGVENQVKYLGMTAPGREVNAVYNMACATICASVYEGFSLAIVESLAAGTPVMTEEGSPFSLGAGCVEYRQETLPETVVRILSDAALRVQICADARENALRRYSWDTIAGDYCREFRNRMNEYGKKT